MPKNEGRAHPSGEKPSPVRKKERNVASILVIDDDANIRALLRRWLERDGYSVIEAEDGEVGIRVFREHLPEVVITDIIMPHKEGLETIMDLHREFPGAQIIAISGGGKVMSGNACLHLASRLGAVRAFSKPLEMPKLLEAIRELLSSQEAPNPAKQGPPS